MSESVRRVRRRWIAVEDMGVHFNLSERIVRYCLGDFKQRANKAVAKAIREERLSRPEACSLCGDSGKIEGHHPDYSRALDVVWVCRKCHRKQSPGLLARLPLTYARRWVAKHHARNEELHARSLKPPRKSTMGSRIAGYRITLNRTVRDVAARLEMNETVLLLWESDQATPSLHEAIRLARELRVSLDYIFAGDGAP